jgi:PDZ domain
MQPEPKKAAAGPEAEAITICPNCHVPMPSTMRFCRSCGFRLGEGVAEYAETVRLHNPTTAPAAGPAQAGTAPYGPPNAWAPIAHAQHAAAGPLGQASAHLGKQQKECGRRRAPWIIWVVLGVTIASVTTGGLLSPFGLKSRSGRSASSVSATRSYVGLGDLETTSGGVTFDRVTPPDSAADKAGLIGGDIITSFDGQAVKSEDQFMKLLASTPVGKTVEVGYTRDGEARKTQMTTNSRDEQNRLRKLFESRPEGKGFLGVNDLDRVPVPGTNLYGVRVDIERNLPADMAGLRDGDIIIEFNGIPIRTPEELGMRIDRALPGSQVILVVMRGSERLQILVKIGKE